MLQDVEGKLAEELVQKCPANVFDIEDMGSGIRLFYRFTGIPPVVGAAFGALFLWLRLCSDNCNNT